MVGSDSEVSDSELKFCFREFKLVGVGSDHNSSQTLITEMFLPFSGIEVSKLHGSVNSRFNLAAQFISRCNYCVLSPEELC